MRNFLPFLLLIIGKFAFSQCSVSLSITNASDSSTCNGSITATIIGGTAPYTYTWSPGGNNVNSATLSNLCSGTTYTVTISDNSGCSSSATGNVGISAPCNQIGANISVSPTTGVNVCDGSILASPYGGIAPYYYSIGNGTVAYGSNNPTNLCSGTYTINVGDANGCSFSTTTIVGIDTCSGLSFAFSNVVNTTSPATCDGSASITANGGTAPYSYTWSNGMIGMNATNLCSGVYQVCVTASNGCQVCDSVFISDSSNVCQGFSAYSQTSNATDALTCDGSMTIFASGGTTPYVYSYANAGTSSNATAANLCIGTYTATVVDANGCAATVVGDVASNSGDTLIINGNIFIDSTVVGVDSSAWINNCSIYYDSIINGYISNYSVLATDSILVSWVLGYNNGDSVIVNSVYNMNSGNGTYVLTLLLYCPIKSVPKYLMVSSEFDYQFSSLNENKSESLFVYPNPAENFIQVKGLKSGSSYRITDLSGKEVISGNYEQVINVSNLGHGTYLLLVTDKNQNKVLRFVK